MLETARTAISDYLERTAERMKAAGLNASWELLDGDAASRILAYVERTSGSLVAIATHGRSGLGRWLLGSVADKVIRSSSRPVLVIRPNPPS
jgi:nucleotide-binding universal stress UspA family protein